MRLRSASRRIAAIPGNVRGAVASCLRRLARLTAVASLCLLIGYIAFCIDIGAYLPPLPSANATLPGEKQAVQLAGLFDRIAPTAGEAKDTQVAPVQPAEAAAPIPELAAPTDSSLQIQAVLVAKRSALIASTMDGRVVRLPFNSGDVFKKGDVLVEYDCGMDRAKLKEIEARARLSEKQLAAYEQLRKLQSVAQIEYETVLENHQQNLAIIEQVKSHIKACLIVAPFKGRVVKRTASPQEFLQTGRVMMEIASREPLQAEFLAPSVWLRWMNVGTPLTVYIEESGKNYAAKVKRIHGEVDPVSQSVQVVAEISTYEEELLPGMSGRAFFDPEVTRQKASFGFLGLMLDGQAQDDTRKKAN